MKSMTGFGRAEGQIENSHYTVEVKSVNHRFLDFRFRMPSALSALEIDLSKLIRKRFDRGAFEIHIRHRMVSGDSYTKGGTRFIVDEGAAQSLHDAYLWLHNHLAVKVPPPPEAYLLTNKVILPVEDPPNVENIFKQLKPIFTEALDALETMRTKEGAAIHDILKNGIHDLVHTVSAIRKIVPKQGDQIRSRLQERIDQWELSNPVNTERLEWEIAFYADRSDTTEELDRLEVISKDFQQLLEKKNQPVGRKLDFVTQELHRELNTLASKAVLSEITKLALGGKSTIEKLRQQVQNVE